VVALEAEPAYQLQIGVRIVCGEAAGRLTIVAWWNGRVIARKTPRECGEDQLTATVTPEMNDPELNRLRLSVVSEGSEEGAVGLRHVTFVASR
jgi:hypothetical protein